MERAVDPIETSVGGGSGDAVWGQMFATESSVGESDLTQGVVSRFLGTLVDRGYELVPAFPISQTDSSVTFVNANVTPYKDALEAGERIASVCHYQLCFRAHGEYPWLLAFGMAGLIADVDSREDLDRISEDSHLATLAGVPDPDYRRERFHVLVDSEDDDLIASVGKALDRHGGTLHVVEEPRIDTRWSYGEKYRLKGYGITYYYRRPGVGCVEECRPDCRCPRWQPLGNLILMTNGERRYAEVGFGVEVTASVGAGSTPYALPEIRSRVERAVDMGLSRDSAIEVVNLYRGVAALVESGVRFSGKGPGSVARKNALRLISLLTAGLGWEKGKRLLFEFGASEALVSVLEEERYRRERVIAKNMEAALDAVVRRPGIMDSNLRSTYGLTTEQIAQVRSAWSRPPRLRSGGTVTVVSPSWRGGSVFPDRVAGGVGDLESWSGLNVIVPEEEGQGGMGRRARAEEFNRALRDPDVDGALWMIGGLVAVELLDLVDYEAFANSPKVLCGYSDVPVLHHALYRRTGVTTFYGPALLSEFAEAGGTPSFTRESFLDVVVRGWAGEYPRTPEVYDEFIDWNAGNQPRRAEPAPLRSVLRPGEAQGPLLPGCVPSLLQLLGTPWLPDYSGHVLALEFSNDDGYGPQHAARDLWQMRHAGLFDRAEGLILGRPRLWSKDQREQLESILLDVCHGLTFPIVTEFEFGHTDPVLTLPTGVPVALSGTDLSLLEPAVR